MCYENIYRDRRHIIPRNIRIILFLEGILRLRPSDGRSGPAYRQFASASRGIGGEEGRISPPLFLFRRPKEGWMLKARLAGWEAVLTGVACKCVIAGQWIGQDGRGTHQFLGLS